MAEFLGNRVMPSSWSQEFSCVHLSNLVAHLTGLHLRQLIVEAERFTLVVVPTRRTGTCPLCQRKSSRIHSHYERTLADLPWGSRPIRLRVQARRFRCVNRRCSQRIFGERFADVVRVHARRTEAQRRALEDFGMEAGGAAGARLAQRRGLAGSGATILRFVRTRPTSEGSTLRVLGVDDWAHHRGQTYGTILVDLEQHRVVDLLEDRTADTFATWLRVHPGVEIIARDRGGAYAEGARQGAPNAIQVADRFHLLANVGEVLERVLARKRTLLKEAATTVSAARSTPEPAPADSPLAEVTTALSAQPTRKKQAVRTQRAARLERYEAVVALDRLGMSQKDIARQVGIGRKTVRRFLRAGGFPERAERGRQRTILDPYEAYLRERWAGGCHNSLQLWREIHDRGFPGAASLVRRFVAGWRARPGRRGPPPRSSAVSPVGSPPPVTPFRVPSPRQARWFLLHSCDQLRPEEQTYRTTLLDRDPEISVAQALAEDFGRLIRERNRAALAPWLKRATDSGLPEFQAFVTVLDRDRRAVEAALTYEWSNGQTEGQINRLKYRKRQMYGRASLPLLKARVLFAA
jgi:transposase